MRLRAAVRSMRLRQRPQFRSNLNLKLHPPKCRILDRRSYRKCASNRGPGGESRPFGSFMADIRRLSGIASAAWGVFFFARAAQQLPPFLIATVTPLLVPNNTAAKPDTDAQAAVKLLYDRAQACTR
jgi:hypothetical protein